MNHWHRSYTGICRRSAVVVAVLVVVTVFLSPTSARAQGKDNAERVLFNAKVFTAVPEHPYAEAVAIRGDKIVAVGNLPEVSRSVSGGAEKIDLQGKSLFPGFIDSHAHPIEGGLDLVAADFTDKGDTVDQLAAFAAEAKRSGKGLRKDVLRITGIPLAIWSRIDELNARFNAGEFGSMPVFLGGMDGHTGWANKTLLQRAGVTKDFLAHLSAGQRAYYGVGADGESNGFAVDEGAHKIQTAVPKPSPEQMVAGGRAAVHYLESLGITAWLDASVDESILSAYKSLAQSGELTPHVAAMWRVNPRNEPAKELEIAQSMRKKFAGIPNLDIPGIKVFADGVVEIPSQTAALTKPYKNTGRSGDLLFEPARFAELATLADKQGLIVHVHALGDRAVKESLNGIEAARKANGDSKLPHTLTHIQLADPEDFPRFQQLGVIAALQLYWAAAEKDTIELMKPYVDPELYRWQYPARSLLNAGAIISGASDWDVSTPNVFLAIYQAETRKGVEGVLDASQSMPREAMFYAYTRNSARALKQQEKIGSLAPGMQADMVLLDRDVLTVAPEEMKQTKVLWTMIGGRTVYRAQ